MMQWEDIEKYNRQADLDALEAYEKGTGEAPEMYKPGYVKAADSSGPILFTASHESPDRMGDVIEAAGWQLTDFKRNPLFLWSHDNFRPPIGRVPKVTVEDKELIASVVFDSEDPFAAEVEGKFRRGFLKAVSVGFRPLEFEQMPQKAEGSLGFGGVRFKKQELLELSAVTIPAHPKALMKALAMRQFYMIVPDLYKVERVMAPEKEVVEPAPVVVPVEPAPAPEPKAPEPEHEKKFDSRIFMSGIKQLKESLVSSSPDEEA